VAAWFVIDVCVLYSRATVPGTVDKKCQLQPATAVFSVLSSLMEAFMCAWNVLFFYKFTPVSCSCDSV